MKPTIIYVYDGLCSWCYGFEPQMQALFEQWHATHDFQFVSGGMFPEAQQQRIQGILGDNFREAYARVAEYSGAVITEKYLDGLVTQENYIVNSDATARAFAAFQSYGKTQAEQLAFIIQLQTNIYQNGLNPNGEALYRETAAHFGLSEDDFLAKMQSEAVQTAVDEAYAYARALQVNSFPQVFLKTTDERYFQLAKGHTTATHISEIIKKIEEEGG